MVTLWRRFFRRAVWHSLFLIFILGIIQIILAAADINGLRELGYACGAISIGLPFLAALLWWLAGGPAWREEKRHTRMLKRRKEVEEERTLDEKFRQLGLDPNEHDDDVRLIHLFTHNSREAFAQGAQKEVKRARRALLAERIITALALFTLITMGLIELAIMSQSKHTNSRRRANIVFGLISLLIPLFTWFMVNAIRRHREDAQYALAMMLKQKLPAREQWANEALMTQAPGVAIYNAPGYKHGIAEGHPDRMGIAAAPGRNMPVDMAEQFKPSHNAPGYRQGMYGEQQVTEGHPAKMGIAAAPGRNMPADLAEQFKSDPENKSAREKHALGEEAKLPSDDGIRGGRAKSPLYGRSDNLDPTKSSFSSAGRGMGAEDHVVTIHNENAPKPRINEGKQSAYAGSSARK